MGAIGIPISEGGRNVLAKILVLINGLTALAGLSIILIGVYIKVVIDRYMVILENYDSGVLPYLLISVGSVTLVIGIAGGKICFDNIGPEKRIAYRHFLFGYVILVLVFSFVLLATALAVRFHTNYADIALHKGFHGAMKKYKKSIGMKTLLDLLQMGYGCCGSRGPTEWFNVSWVPNNYVDTESSAVKKLMKKGQVYVDSVPFSCCRADVLRPCIHHDLLHGSKHFRYKAGSHATIYKTGCSKSMIEHFENAVLIPLSAVVGILFLVECVITILTRFLQSSINNAIVQLDLVGSAYGYLFGSLPENKPDEDGGKSDKVSRKGSSSSRLKSQMSLRSKRSSKEYQNVQYAPVPNETYIDEFATDEFDEESQAQRRPSLTVGYSRFSPQTVPNPPPAPPLPPGVPAPPPPPPVPGQG